ncbi:unnamed protein product (macronuclear) [Paramecium tetraurelia]|uniref:Protein kinase domain-containing protein n=1 Tax=Paramecium tetraurelia TaxID=5888 RepID=A0DYG9_PARTE|nr:uncharacterized protein GSPATT00003054001 [Paramecium tetraurelia]CAK88086.1 unnamed protein product [Paramecium tetraurelia]|eukprot:XP_001455483.1 hypothetical protein (macronuclear) [Paramecium tetraurelia strain d4-2]
MNNPSPQKLQQIDIDKIQILTDIDKTHQSTVSINLIKYESQIMVQKSILLSSLQTQQQIQHLHNERQALQELDYPSINKIIATKKDDLNIHLFLKFEKGMPLHKLLRNVGKINQKFSTLFFIQILITFNYLHENGWLYRDLKASNVIITQEFRVKLIDFGMAKKIEKGRTSSYCGTIHSMPPEIIKNDGYEYDYSFDIYTIGILFYEMLVGKPPFGLNVQGIEQRILEGIKEDQLSVIEDIKIRELLKNLLSHNPKQRPNCQQLLQEDFIIQNNYNEIKKFMENEEANLNSYKSDLYDEEIYLYCTQFAFNENDNDDFDF